MPTSWSWHIRQHHWHLVERRAHQPLLYIAPGLGALAHVQQLDVFLVTAFKVHEPNQVPKCGGGQQHVNPLPSQSICVYRSAGLESTPVRVGMLTHARTTRHPKKGLTHRESGHMSVQSMMQRRRSRSDSGPRGDFPADPRPHHASPEKRPHAPRERTHHSQVK
jgi:hypothetical protein